MNQIISKLERDHLFIYLKYKKYNLTKWEEYAQIA